MGATTTKATIKAGKATAASSASKKSGVKTATKAASAKKTSKSPVAAVAKDSVKPKRPLSAYMFWLQDNRPKITASLPKKDQNNMPLVSKAAGARWKKVTARAKLAYEKKSVTASKQYKKALEKYEAAQA